MSSSHDEKKQKELAESIRFKCRYLNADIKIMLAETDLTQANKMAVSRLNDLLAEIKKVDDGLENRDDLSNLDAVWSYVCKLEEYVEHNKKKLLTSDTENVQKQPVAKSKMSAPKPDVKPAAKVMDIAAQRKVAIDRVNAADIPKEFKQQIRDRIGNPSCMNQEENSLCGPVAFIMHLAAADPIKYAETAIQLISKKSMTIENKTSGVTLQLRNNYSAEEMKTRSIDMIFLSALRRDTNVFGIYRSVAKVGEKVESFLGFTFPDDFVKWFKAFFGDCPVRNTAQLFVDGHAASPTIQALAGVHSDSAYADMDKNLRQAVSDTHSGYATSMFMTLGLTNLIIALANNKDPSVTYIYNPNDDERLPVLGIECCHYVKVNKLEVVSKKDGKYVDIEIDTWGKNYKTSVPYAEFMQGYRGCISAKVSQMALEEKVSLKKGGGVSLFAEKKQPAAAPSIDRRDEGMKKK